MFESPPHSPITQFFATKITDDKNCYLFIGHEDGSVSCIACHNISGQLENLKYNLYIEQIHSDQVFGFLEYNSDFVISWSRNELKVVANSDLKIFADLSNHVSNCGNICKVLLNTYQHTLLVIMESGRVVVLRLGDQFTITHRGDLSLIDLLPQEYRERVGKVKFVTCPRMSLLFCIAWTGKGMSIFRTMPDVKCLDCWSLDAKLHAISSAGLTTFTVKENQHEGMVLTNISFFTKPIEYKNPKEEGKEVCSYAF